MVDLAVLWAAIRRGSEIVTASGAKAWELGLGLGAQLRDRKRKAMAKRMRGQVAATAN